MIYEMLGYAGTALIVASMLFKTTSFKGTMLMRVINLIGSIAFVIYGFGANAMPTAVSNVLLIIINTVYIIIECMQHKKEKENNNA